MKYKILQIVPLCLAIIMLMSCKTPSKSSQTQSSREKEFNSAKVAESNNRFALDLFKQINPGRENIIYSPYSISNILALVYGGTHGKTAAEMADVLYFPKNNMSLHGAEMILRESLDSINSMPGTELIMANAIWAQESFTFLPGYFELAETSYGAPLELVDFIQSYKREESRTRINN